MMDKGVQIRSNNSSQAGRIAKAAIGIAKEIYEAAMALEKPDLSQVDLRRGFEVSKSACAQAESVPITPVMKNIIQAFDHPDDGWELKVDTPETKGESWVKDVVKTKLYALYGDKKDYDESLPVDSKLHYGVDCWRNFKDNMRDIQPGQFDERFKLAQTFGEKEDAYKIFTLIEDDPLFWQAFKFLYDTYPITHAEQTFVGTAEPFMSKHTNVGFKWWYNDKVRDPKTGLTYGQIAQKAAEGLTFKMLPQWNVCTAYGRNQRGKGRLLIASARPVNLFLNRLEAKEIERLKHVSYFAGYNDAAYLKTVLINFAKFCKSRKFKCSNWDQSKFDLHINPAWLAIVGALRVMKAKGALGKDLAKWRAMLNIHSWLVNGMSGKIEEIYGRMFSGFIDTNQGDGLVEVLIFTYCLMKQNSDYSDEVMYATMYWILVMGDDCLVIDNPLHFDHDVFVKDMADLGFEINKDKGEFGTFFLQYRLYEDGEQSYVMVYPWTRVLRSMLFTEKTKGLGPYGWLLAQYQQLSKLQESAEALDAVVSIIYPFDKLKLGVDMSVQQILDGVKAEDKQAAATQSSRQYSSTAEKLYDGDPAKQSQFRNDGQDISTVYLEIIHKAVKDSVNRLGRANMRHAATKVEKSSESVAD